MHNHPKLLRIEKTALERKRAVLQCIHLELTEWCEFRKKIMSHKYTTYFGKDNLTELTEKW